MLEGLIATGIIGIGIWWGAPFLIIALITKSRNRSMAYLWWGIASWIGVVIAAIIILVQPEKEAPTATKVVHRSARDLQAERQHQREIEAKARELTGREPRHRPVLKSEQRRREMRRRVDA